MVVVFCILELIIKVLPLIVLLGSGHSHYFTSFVRLISLEGILKCFWSSPKVWWDLPCVTSNPLGLLLKPLLWQPVSSRIGPCLLAFCSRDLSLPPGFWQAIGTTWVQPGRGMGLPSNSLQRQSRGTFQRTPQVPQDQAPSPYVVCDSVHLTGFPSVSFLCHSCSPINYCMQAFILSSPFRTRNKAKTSNKGTLTERWLLR